VTPSPYEVVIREREEPRPTPEIVNSWAPRRSKEKRTVAQATRDVAKSFASWVILVALAIDLLALTIEPTLLLHYGAPLRAAIGGTLAAVGLSALFSMAAALPIAGVYSLVRLIGSLPRPWNLVWPLPLVALAWAVVVDVAPHPFVSAAARAEARPVLFGLLAGLMLLSTAVTRLRNPWYRGGCSALLGATMVGLSSALPPTIHREPRDVLWLCTVVCAAALLYPLRRKMREASNERVGHAFGTLCVSSLALGLLAPVVSPNYRVYARDYGSFADRLARFSRALADFDGDGFSPVLGGLDCNDWDPLRNPGMPEQVDGRDRNCNGLMRFADSSPSQRGLAPAVGEPDAAPGEIERVVLITIDCMRNDVWSTRVTPNLARLAAQGLTFTKLYAGGARTAISLPLVLRSAYPMPSVASILGEAGVSSTAVFAYRHSTLGDNVFRGFGLVRRPSKNDLRFRATEVTDQALDDLRDPANARMHFLWVHYFDAHGPRTSRVLPPDVARFPPLPNEDPDSALYQSELAYDDREIGRLLDGIEQTGGLGRTLVAISSDHGEAFGLRNVYEHGQSAFEEVVHVPGILVGPGIVPGRYEHVASHRDVAATIAGAFGLVSKNPRVEEFGRSWLRLRAAREAPLHRFVITYSASAHVQSFADAPMVVRTDDTGKLAVGYLEGIERLYHLDSSEGERRDVAPDYPDEAARDRFELEVYRDIDRAP
jgi:hypothetical protein